MATCRPAGPFVRLRPNNASTQKGHTQHKRACNAYFHRRSQTTIHRVFFQFVRDTQ